MKSLKNYIILALLGYFIFFHKIQSFHLRWWDESVYAINAVELNEHHQPYLQTADEHVDDFTLKPPLFQWMQSTSLKIFGINELGVRFPSALAGMLTLFIVFIFTRKHINLIAAWLASLTLLCAEGYSGYHGVRTGDMDALLTLFLTLANLFLIEFLCFKFSNRIFWFAFFLGFACSVKLNAGLLFGPGYLLLFIYFQGYKNLLKNKWFYLSILGFSFPILMIVVPWYVENPQFLDYLINRDMGRYFSQISHENHWHFYLDNLFRSRLKFFMFLIPMGIIVLIQQWDKRTVKNKIQKSLLVLIAFYLVIISISSSQQFWYDLPLFPLMSIFIGITIYQIIRTPILNLRVTFGILFLFAYPYFLNFRNSQNESFSQNELKEEAFSHYLHKGLKEKKNLDGATILYFGWNRAILFYQKAFAQQNQEIKITKEVATLNENDVVLVTDDSLYQSLSEQFDFKIIENRDFVFKVELGQKKDGVVQTPPLTQNP